MTAIAPARYRDLSVRDGTAEPFGTWQVDYVSMFGQYQQFGQSNFDIAVVTYKPRIRNNPNCRELYVRILQLPFYSKCYVAHLLDD